MLTGAAVALIGMTGCDDSVVAPQQGTYYSSTFTLGNGTARSFVKIDNAGNPTEVGLVMSEQAINGLPGGDGHDDGHAHEHSIDIPMPPQASKTPYDHIGLDWNPAGHPPGPYLLPHFDVHFYMMTRAERTAMTGTGNDSVRIVTPPDAKYIPTGYISTNEGVPQMGMHWVDPTSPELNGSTFTETMIWGTYDGRIVFTEPMITREFLLARPNVAKNLKLPVAYQKTGRYYPTTYHVRYDAGAKEYVVSLGGMTQR